MHFIINLSKGMRVYEYNFCRIVKNKINILAIDDDPIMLFTLRLIFRDEKRYNLITEKNSLVALKLLDQYSTSIKIVLLNLIMPKMSGIELLANMRSSNNLKNIPIIIQSPITSENDLFNADSNYKTYLQKSFNEKRLFHLLSFILEKNAQSNYFI